VIPADITAETARRVKELSLATFRALELSGLARVDFTLKPSRRAWWSWPSRGGPQRRSLRTGL
jgi:D-alanine-D-alanine ligase-like ATP-grasp enzyme